MPGRISVADVRGAFARRPGSPADPPAPALGDPAVGDPPVLPSLPPDLPATDPRPAAVLCALFEEGGQAHVVLTRRSRRLRSHTGEVAFPGGRLDAGEGPSGAALREAEEEVGLDPSSVEIIGALTPLSTLTSRSAIMPFVAVLPGRPALVPNPAEVERVFAVPLVDLVAPGAYHAELWDVLGRPERPIHFFDLPGETVWGATARLLRELLDRVLGADR
ncbi:MAG TPA: CoA pyrophosphatase [Acidimicrobiales bacterium]|nr:CoA pyrophosphatase [Acidimicrobiales bacterium]